MNCFKSLLLFAFTLSTIQARADEPAKEPEGRLIMGDETKFLVLKPDGKKLEEIPGLPDGTHPSGPILGALAISPDGKQAAFIVKEERSGETHHHVLIRDVEGKGAGTKVEVEAQYISWVTDKKLLAMEAKGKDQKQPKYATWLVDVATNNKAAVDVPESAQVFAATRDGKSYLASEYDESQKKCFLSLIGRDDKKITHLTQISPVNRPFLAPKLSPNESLVLFCDEDRETKPTVDKPIVISPRLFVFDNTTRKRERVNDQPRDASIESFAWSPDSKKLVYSWIRSEVDNNHPPLDGKLVLLDKETEWQVTVADANGSNAMNIFKAKVASVGKIALKPKNGVKGASVANISSYIVDWR